ncbi:MAG TPA: hypothetical protein GX014_02395 [Firmicutes bacterium]|jgi:hypothetical protein|nr:hypothetical protein [Bacillota bacterium]
MKTLLKALVLVLLMAPLVSAEAPILSGQGVLGRETIMIRQSVQLWVAAEGAWQLTGSSAQDVTLFDWRGEPAVSGRILEGSGPYQGSLQLECHWHSPFAAGRYERELRLALDGAKGILGLALAAEHWILPLSNHQVWVERDEAAIVLPSGKWFLLQLGDGLPVYMSFAALSRRSCPLRRW